MTKPKPTCKTCQSYKPNTAFPLMKAGKCKKGMDLISISCIFDCKESQWCRRWEKKGTK